MPKNQGGGVTRPQAEAIAQKYIQVASEQSTPRLEALETFKAEQLLLNTEMQTDILARRLITDSYDRTETDGKDQDVLVAAN